MPALVERQQDKADRNVGKNGRPSGPRTHEGRRTGRRPDREAVRQGLDHAPRPEGRHPADRRHSDRLHQHRLRARRRRRAARPRHRNLRPGVVGQDDAGAAGDRGGAEARRHGGVRGRGARARRRATRRSSASTSTTCSSRSPTTASRRSKSSKSSSARTAWTSSSSTRSPRSCRRRKSKARWATRRWACRRASCRRRSASSPASVSKSKTCLIFINQLREKIGVMFGNPETTTGGRALKFYASVRIDIRRIASIKDGDAVVGGRTRVKVVKNKVAPPFREAEFDVMYGEGISRTGDLLDLGVEKRIVEKSGAWFAYGGERLGQGRENAKQFLKDNPGHLQGDRRSRAPRARADARGRARSVARTRPRHSQDATGAPRSRGARLRARSSRSCYDRQSPRSGEVAQLVEHTTENRSVDGSIPPLATIKKPS